MFQRYAPLLLAFRYFLSTKNTSVVNFITAVASIGVMFSVMAMVLVSSVFQGLERFTVSKLDNFHADIEIKKHLGKHFSWSEEQKNKLLKLTEILDCAEVLEEKAFLKYRGNEHISQIKGVSSNYANVTTFQDGVVVGRFIRFKKTKLHEVILGKGVSEALSLGIYDKKNPLQIYLPRTQITYATRPDQMYRKDFSYPVGIFNISEYNDRYILAPISLVRNLLQLSKNYVSSLELKVKKDENLDEVKLKLTKILDETFQIKTRAEQQDYFYKLINS